MSRRKIERALLRKGLSAEIIEYNRQPTPHGMMAGWEIQLDDQSVDLALEYGCEPEDLEPDCENVSEALDWIARLPDCFDGASALLSKEKENG